MNLQYPPAYYAGLYSHMVDLRQQIAEEHAEGYSTDHLLEELVDAAHDWCAAKWEAGA